jgi:hypothetical protein
LIEAFEVFKTTLEIWNFTINLIFFAPSHSNILFAEIQYFLNELSQVSLFSRYLICLLSMSGKSCLNNKRQTFKVFSSKFALGEDCPEMTSSNLGVQDR